MIASKRGLDDRIQRSRVQTFCQPGRRVEHPILPRTALICPARAARHFEADPQKVLRIDTPLEQCLFCGGKHPSVLAFVGDDLETTVPGEESSFRAAEAWLKDQDPDLAKTYYDLTSHIQPHNAISHRDLVRIFLNLTPATASPEEACFVSAVHPDHHDDDLSTIADGVPAALVRSWQLLEAWAVAKGMHAAFFLNGGRRAPSGQSVGCLHGQTYVVQEVPTLFKAIRDRRDTLWNGDCPICKGLAGPVRPGRLALAVPGTPLQARSRRCPRQRWPHGLKTNAFQRSDRAFP